LLFGILPAARDISGALRRAGAAPQRALRWLTTVVQVRPAPVPAPEGALRPKLPPLALRPPPPHRPLAAQVKAIPPGWCVGYECRAQAPAGGGTVALLPLGSHDGFLEPASGFTHVAVRGVLRPVLAVDANLVVVDAVRCALLSPPSRRRSPLAPPSGESPGVLSVRPAAEPPP